MSLEASAVPDDAPDLPPAYRLVALDRVDSTSDEARRRAEAGAEDGTLVWALEQTAGRGRRERAWVSPPGNLYFSMVLRPDCDLPTATQLSFVTAVALGATLGEVVPPLTELAYKWPNDVLLMERKVAGILLESSSGAGGGLDHLIVGVGVNVASRPDAHDIHGDAICLREIGCGPEVTPAAVLSAFARHFLSWVNHWLDEGFAPIRAAWLQRAVGQGETLTWRPADGAAPVTGVFSDLDDAGALILDVDGEGFRSITAGEVFRGPPTSD